MAKRIPREATIRGYVRRDGRVGVRNHLLVIAAIDLVNTVCCRIADAIPTAVAVLTPAGGLSHGREATLIRTMRLRLCDNPNVGAVLLVGTNAGDLSDLEAAIRALGKPVSVVSLIEAIDAPRAVRHGIAQGRRLARRLAAARRQSVPLSALCIGLKSSASAAASAKIINPVVGDVTDLVASAGGTVIGAEIADLCGGAPLLVQRGASPRVARALGRILQRASNTLLRLDKTAPDPTPMNRLGGIRNIAQKSRLAFQRFGRASIQSVVDYGVRPRGPGLHIMKGPGSAAISITGLTASGCTLIIHTVGMTSATPASPIAPLVKIGGARLSRSADVDVVCTDESAQRLKTLRQAVMRIASGGKAAQERLDDRTIMLPAYLPPL